MYEENYDSTGRKMADAAKSAVQQEIKRKGRKKIITVILATNCGCLIPLLIIIFSAVFIGMVSSAQVSIRYNYEDIKKEAAELGLSAKEYLFNKLYSDATKKIGFKESDLSIMAFDRKTLNNMFDLIAKYNDEKLEKTINVEFEGSFAVWIHTGYNTYEFQGKTYKYETGYWKTVKAYDVKPIELTNTWLREKYPIDWQVIYVLCFYDALDNGDKAEEYFEGKKIRVKKKFIEDLIEDVAAKKAEILELCDVGTDYVWEKYSGHDLDAVEYNWGLLSLLKVSQEKVHGYGAYEPITPYYAPYYYQGKVYNVLFQGDYPISELDVVYTLTTKDTYNGTTLISSEYDITKLELLMEKYAPQRDIPFLIAAIKELPGGEEVAAEIEMAYREVEAKRRAEEQQN